jgi:hypothetical protein
VPRLPQTRGLSRAAYANAILASMSVTHRRRTCATTEEEDRHVCHHHVYLRHTPVAACIDRLATCGRHSGRTHRAMGTPRIRHAAGPEHTDPPTPIDDFDAYARYVTSDVFLVGHLGPSIFGASLAILGAAAVAVLLAYGRAARLAAAGLALTTSAMCSLRRHSAVPRSSNPE